MKKKIALILPLFFSPLFGRSYDEQKQKEIDREEQRKMQIKIHLGGLVTLFALFFTERYIAHRKNTKVFNEQKEKFETLRKEEHSSINLNKLRRDSKALFDELPRDQQQSILSDHEIMQNINEEPVSFLYDSEPEYGQANRPSLLDNLNERQLNSARNIQLSDVPIVKEESSFVDICELVKSKKVEIIDYLILSNSQEEFLTALKQRSPANQDTVLHCVCWEGVSDILKSINKVIGKEELFRLLRLRRKGGWTPLHNACWQGHKEVVDLLLEYVGLENFKKLTNLKTDTERKPIDLAKNKKHSELVKLLTQVENE
jgi:ankyrin repeat protein